MRMSSTVDQFKFSEWKSLSIVKTLDRADEFGKRTPVDIRREEQENPGKVIKSLSGTQKTRLGFRIPLRKVPKKVTIIISKREESKRWWWWWGHLRNSHGGQKRRHMGRRGSHTQQKQGLDTGCGPGLCEGRQRKECWKERNQPKAVFEQSAQRHMYLLGPQKQIRAWEDGHLESEELTTSLQQFPGLPPWLGTTHLPSSHSPT